MMSTGISRMWDDDGGSCDGGDGPSASKGDDGRIAWGDDCPSQTATSCHWIEPLCNMLWQDFEDVDGRNEGDWSWHSISGALPFYVHCVGAAAVRTTQLQNFGKILGYVLYASINALIGNC